jgi:hypothetical protein
MNTDSHLYQLHWRLAGSRNRSGRDRKTISLTQIADTPSTVALLHFLTPRARNHNGRLWQKLRTKKFTLNKFPFICLNNLKFIERRKSNCFHLRYSLSVKFLAPWTPLPGAAAPFSPPNPSYARGPPSRNRSRRRHVGPGRESFLRRYWSVFALCRWSFTAAFTAARHCPSYPVYTHCKILHELSPRLDFSSSVLPTCLMDNSHAFLILPIPDVTMCVAER